MLIFGEPNVVLPVPSPISAMENLGGLVLRFVKRAAVEYPQKSLISKAGNLAIQVLNIGDVIALR